MSSFLILNSFHVLSLCFSCYLWTGNSLLGRIISQGQPLKTKSFLPFNFAFTKICVSIRLAQDGTRMRHVVIISLILALSPSISMLLMRTFKMADVTISEVRLKTLMKEIFKEFEKQQKNLLNLISGNFDITMTEIKKVQSDINELIASLKHRQCWKKTLLKERRK